MAQKCRICAHPDRHQMEDALTAAETFRSVADRFAVSRSSLWQHWQSHIQPIRIDTALEVVPKQIDGNLLATINGATTNRAENHQDRVAAIGPAKTTYHAEELSRCLQPTDRFGRPMD